CMLVAHKLSAEDVPLGAQKIEIGETRYEPDDWGQRRMKQRSSWQMKLANSIARAHLCRLLVPYKSNAVIFVGERSDRECAVYVFAKLVHVCERICQKKYREARREGINTRGFMTSFYHGFSDAVSERVRAQIIKSRGDIEKGSTSALVRMDASRKARDDYMSGFGTYRGGDDHKVNHAGRAEGSLAGSNADLRADGIESDKNNWALEEGSA